MVGVSVRALGGYGVIVVGVVCAFCCCDLIGLDCGIQLGRLVMFAQVM